MNGYKIKTDRFSYKDRNFSAFISDFSRLEQNAIFTARVFGQGFQLTSENTGKMVKVALKETHKDNEGDITHWEFIPMYNDSFDSVLLWNT